MSSDSDTDEMNKFERGGEQAPNEQPSEYYETWQESMVQGDDVPPYNPELQWARTAEEKRELAESGGATGETDGASAGEEEGVSPESLSDEELAGDFSHAGDAMNFGLNTASEIYGLEAVLAAVEDVDETGRDAMNPLGAIYDRLAPTPEAQTYLFLEMKKDLAKLERTPRWLAPHDEELAVTHNAEGKLCERDPETGRPEDSSEKSVAMVQALKRLIEALETDERFEGLRARARELQMEPLDYLLKDEVKPTLRNFLEEASGAAEIDVDEIVKELAEDEAEKAEELAAEAAGELGLSEDVAAIEGPDVNAEGVLGADVAPDTGVQTSEAVDANGALDTEAVLGENSALGADDAAAIAAFRAATKHDQDKFAA